MKETIKLYDLDSHLAEFDATVTACSADEAGIYVTLDRTAFFPEGGGQAADTGTLDGTIVTDVQEKDGEIRHYLGQPIACGAYVHGALDWEKRFSRMQHHSAEHIVSGLVHREYGFDNIGFHLTDTGATLDFSGELSAEQLEEIELAANRAVWENIPVSAVYPEPAALVSIPYRSKLELTENVRIVTIPDYDICACCAPHVAQTGEIGCIKLLDPMRHRGGTRVTLYAGQNSYTDYAAKYQNARTISALLSAKQNETAAAVEKLHAASLEIKRALAETKKQLMEYKVSALSATDGHLLLFESDLDAQTMRGIANRAAEKCGGIFVILSGGDTEGYSYIAASRTQQLRSFAKTLHDTLGGKGGGSDAMIQGKLPAARHAIEQFFASLS